MKIISNKSVSSPRVFSRKLPSSLLSQPTAESSRLGSCVRAYCALSAPVLFRFSVFLRQCAPPANHCLVNVRSEVFSYASPPPSQIERRPSVRVMVSNHGRAADQGSRPDLGIADRAQHQVQTSVFQRQRRQESRTQHIHRTQW